MNVNVNAHRLLTPYIAVIAGGLATWLAGHHVLGLFGANQTQAATVITQGLTFLMTTGVVWLGHQKWLDGLERKAAADLEHAGVDQLAAPPPPPPAAAAAPLAAQTPPTGTTS